MVSWVSTANYISYLKLNVKPEGNQEFVHILRDSLGRVWIPLESLENTKQAGIAGFRRNSSLSSAPTVYSPYPSRLERLTICK